jgi:hypothetical protein
MALAATIVGAMTTCYAVGQELVPAILPHERPVLISRTYEPADDTRPKRERAAAERAKHWVWSPKGDHHHAIVHVNAWGSGGSGVVVYAVPDHAYIMTAAHVVGGRRSAKVRWRNKRGWGVGSVVAVDRRNDIALIKQLTTRQALYAPIASKPPDPGERLELAGFGGPGDQLRHFYGPMLDRSASAIYASANALNGDSGGPAFDSQHRVVGIISGGSHVQSFGLFANNSDWKLHYPVRCSQTEPMQRLLAQVGCWPYQQQVQYGQPCYPQWWRQPQRQQPEYTPPPEQQPSPSPDAQPKPPPSPGGPERPEAPPPQQLEIDMDELVRRLCDSIKADAELQLVLRGEDGTDGKDGVDGADGTDGSDAVVNMDDLVAKVLAALEEAGVGQEPVLAAQKNAGEIESLKRQIEIVVANADQTAAQLRDLANTAKANASAAASVRSEVTLLRDDVATQKTEADGIENELRQQAILLKHLREEQRTQSEIMENIASGSLRFRLHIGDDGRITGVEKVPVE